MRPRDIIRVCGLLMTLSASATGGALADSRGPPERGWPDDRPLPGCPTREQIVARIESHLGRALRDADPSLRIQTSYERTQAGYRITLLTAHEGDEDPLAIAGRRAFEGASCSDVADAAALLVALGIDPLAAASVPSSTPEPSAAGPRARPPSVPSRTAGSEVGREPPSAPQTRAAGSLRPGLRAGALLDVGYLPRAGVGLELGTGLSSGSSRVELTGLWLPGVSSSRAEAGARVKVSLWALRASYCQRFLASARGRLRAAGCAGLELGRASGDGVDLLDARQQRYLWRAGWAALRLSSALTRWLALSIEPGLAVPFARARFVSSDADGAVRSVLHTSRPVSARVALSLEALF